MSSLPPPLRVAAAIFGAIGVLDLAEALAAPSLDYVGGVWGIAHLCIAVGLLRTRPLWRWCGLGVLWFEMIALPLAILMAITSEGVTWDMFGATIVGLGAYAIMFTYLALAAYRYALLTRADVRLLFRAGA